MLEYIPLLVLMLLAGAGGGYGMALARSARTAGGQVTCEDPQLAQLEGELEQARSDAKAQKDRRARALSHLSHEMRTPLNGILGFTEMLLADDLEDSHRRQVTMISESGRAMLRLLNDILEIARLDSGHFRLVEEAASLREELQYCADMMLPNAALRGLALEWHVDEAIPASVLLDRSRLREVLLNLVGNALKFTAVGQVTVEASALGEGAERLLEISVRDTGIGIAAERREAIFEPFFNAPGKSAEPSRSSGLGLPIARQVIRHMGGELELESTLGIGSTFTITLPLRACEPPEKATGFASEAPARSEVTPPPRVLVAEDNSVNQQLILAMLASLGIKADLAADGVQAIAAVEQAAREGSPFNLVLMDLQMPEMGGMDAARKLRKAGHAPHNLAIIALSADCFPDDVARCMAAGMQDHIAKPVRLADLAEKLAPYGLGTRAPDTVDHRLIAHKAPFNDLDLRLQKMAAPADLASLEEKYAGRKQQLFELLRQAMDGSAGQIDWERLLRELHKIAGTAASFGNAELGVLARDLGKMISATRLPEKRLALLPQAYAQLRRAA